MARIRECAARSYKSESRLFSKCDATAHEFHNIYNRLSAVRALHLDVARGVRHKACLLLAAYNGRCRSSKVLGGTLGLFSIANRIRKLGSKNHPRSSNGRRLG